MNNLLQLVFNEYTLILSFILCWVFYIAMLIKKDFLTYNIIITIVTTILTIVSIYFIINIDFNTIGISTLMLFNIMLWQVMATWLITFGQTYERLCGFDPGGGRYIVVGLAIRLYIVYVLYNPALLIS